MSEILDYLTNANIMELAMDIRVLVAAGVLFLLAAYYRWKYILALLVAFGGTITVIHYSNIQDEAAIDNSLIYFGVGTVLIAVVLIYILFIQGDD